MRFSSCVFIALVALIQVCFAAPLPVYRPIDATGLARRQDDSGDDSGSSGSGSDGSGSGSDDSGDGSGDGDFSQDGGAAGERMWKH